jgi:hypothetical protein
MPTRRGEEEENAKNKEEEFGDVEWIEDLPPVEPCL